VRRFFAKDVASSVSSSFFFGDVDLRRPGDEGSASEDEGERAEDVDDEEGDGGERIALGSSEEVCKLVEVANWGTFLLSSSSSSS
jgi:hypothetical protein